MKDVRFGLVGYGAWGTHHARAIAETEGAELVAVATRSAESRSKAQSAHPGAEMHADHRELITGRDVDVVDVVLPNHLHAEVGEEVLKSNKHLFIEKPMAITTAECRRLTRLAASQVKLLAVGFEFRLSELWGRVKHMIDEGAIGSPQYLVMDLWRRPYRQGSQGWRYDLQKVGDWILEEPVHFFDLARWYMALLGDPLSVYACANSKQAGHSELQDNFSAIVRFPKEGHAVITHTLSAFEHHQTVKLTGTEGALWASWTGVMDRDARPASRLKYFDGKEVRDIPLTCPTGELFELREEIAMMVAAVRDSRPLAATGTDGLWSVRLCEAARESIRANHEISLS